MKDKKLLEKQNETYKKSATLSKNNVATNNKLINNEKYLLKFNETLS